jgi:hypothetical protein
MILSRIYCSAIWRISCQIENDVILCQITSQAVADSYAASLIDGDLGKPITTLIWPVVAES